MKYILILLAAVFISVSGYGQYTFSGSTSGSITVSTVMAMSFTNNTGTVSFSSASNYQNGQTISNYASLAIKSNIPWKLTYAAQAALFTATGGGASTNMPCGIVSLKQSTGSTFTAISTTSTTLVNGNAGNAAATGNSFNIDMNINPGFTYKGGTYSLGIIFTLTNQ